MKITMSEPKITVMMPVFNGARYLRASIDSILNQTFSDFELLIIDDGSSDSSIEIIKSFKDNRINLLQNGQNLGLPVTRNKGLSSAKGKYIALLDSDDIAHPERLMEQVSFLEQNSDFGMVGSWIQMIDEYGEATGEVMKYTAAPDEIPVYLLFNNYFAQSALLIRKAALPDEGYDVRYSVAEDYDLWTRITARCKTWNLQRVLTSYRVHSDSTSSNKFDVMETFTLDIIKKQLNALDIFPKDSELTIHRCIGNQSFETTISFLTAVESWLLKLYEANNRTRRYNSICLKDYIGRKWSQVCFTSYRLGPHALQIFRNSALKEFCPPAALATVQFYCKCLLSPRRNVS